MFKVRDKFALEVHEAKERGNVLGHKKRRPVLVKFALGHRWAVSVVAAVNANKFKSRGKEDAFLQGEGQVLGQADLKLAGHVRHSNFKGWSPAEYVVNDYSSASLCIKNNTTVVRKVLPSGVKVVNEYSEDDRAINRTKRHDSVCVFRTVRSSKG